MSRKKRKDTKLCESFCSYYKPGKNEELACQGYVVVQRIISRGKALPLGRPQRTRHPDADTRRVLEERVCLHCEFREQDCDFIATGGNAPSCGGFVLLSHLLASGDLTAEEIE
jgi:hypothetical protein